MTPRHPDGDLNINVKYDDYPAASKTCLRGYGMLMHRDGILHEWQCIAGGYCFFSVVALPKHLLQIPSTIYSTCGCGHSWVQHTADPKNTGGEVNKMYARGGIKGMCGGFFSVSNNSRLLQNNNNNKYYAFTSHSSKKYGTQSLLASALGLTVPIRGLLSTLTS